MVNKKALAIYRNTLAKKQTISKSTMAISTPSKQVGTIHPSNTIEAKNEQIAVLEAQLATLKSLNVSTSTEKVS